MTRARHTLRVRTPMAERLQRVLAAQGAAAELVAPDRVEVTGGSTEQVGVLAAEQAIPVFETTTGGVGLEDVFFQLTAQASAKENAR